MLAAALAYADRGYRPIPAARQAKNTIVRWKHLNARTGPYPSRQEIEDWWTRYPDANIALVTGHGLAVWDLDGPDALDLFITEVGAIPDGAPIVQSPHGLHIYCRYDPALTISSQAKLLLSSDGQSQVDLRAQGGYVIAPPSAVDGAPYRVTSGSLFSELPSMSPAMLRLAKKGTSRPTGRSNAVIAPGSTITPEPTPRCPPTDERSADANLAAWQPLFRAAKDALIHRGFRPARSKPGEYRGRCILPGHHRRGDQRPSAGYNEDKGTYNCFGCNTTLKAFEVLQHTDTDSSPRALERAVQLGAHWPWQGRAEASMRRVWEVLAAEAERRQSTIIGLSMRELEARTGLSIVTVQDAKRRLRERGLITVTHSRLRAHSDSYCLRPYRSDAESLRSLPVSSLAIRTGAKKKTSVIPNGSCIVSRIRDAPPYRQHVEQCLATDLFARLGLGPQAGRLYAYFLAGDASTSLSETEAAALLGVPRWRATKILCRMRDAASLICRCDRPCAGLHDFSDGRWRRGILTLADVQHAGAFRTVGRTARRTARHAREREQFRQWLAERPARALRRDGGQRRGDTGSGRWSGEPVWCPDHAAGWA